MMKTFCLFITCCLLPALALADTGNASADSDKHKYTFDIRLVGGPLGTFIDEPSEADKVETLGDGITRIRRPYSGFGGLGSSFGLTLGLTYNDFLGFETGFIRRMENAEATYTVNGASLDLEVSQTSTTVPLLLRLTLPTSSVQPSVLIGMALHYPSETELKSAYLADLSAEADSYQTLNFGFELEFKLPVENYDVRIPLSMRGYHNADLGDSVVERMRFSGCGPTGQCDDNIFITEWQWAAEILLGLSFHTNLFK